MDDEPTCGKGLAAAAGLPARIADMLDALAATLDAHRPALDLSQPAGRAEDEAYAALVDDFRDVAVRLEAVAQRMEECRSLPVADHDDDVMAEPARMEPYGRFIAVQRDLIPMLQASVAAGEEMIRET